MLYNIFYILLNIKKEKQQIYSTNKNRINEIIRDLNNIFILAKKNFDKIEEKFLIEIPHCDSSKIFEVENTYFLTIKSDRQVLEAFTTSTGNADLERYLSFSANLNKVFVYIQALIEKYEKEKEKAQMIEMDLSSKKLNQFDGDLDDIDNNEEKENDLQDKLGSKFNPILPVEEWDNICSESYRELESTVKIREDLRMTETLLKNKVLTEKKIFIYKKTFSKFCIYNSIIY